jgi:hypothetical protein
MQQQSRTQIGFEHAWILGNHLLVRSQGLGSLTNLLVTKATVVPELFSPTPQGNAMVKVGNGFFELILVHQQSRDIFRNLRIGAVQRKTPFKAFRGLLGMAAFEVCAAT